MSVAAALLLLPPLSQSSVMESDDSEDLQRGRDSGHCSLAGSVEEEDDDSFPGPLPLLLNLRNRLTPAATSSDVDDAFSFQYGPE